MFQKVSSSWLLLSQQLFYVQQLVLQRPSITLSTADSDAISLKQRDLMQSLHFWVWLLETFHQIKFEINH